MTHSSPYEHVMQMVLVREERTLAMENPKHHDPDGVENRDAEYGQSHGDHAGILMNGHEMYGRVASQRTDSEPDHYDTDHHGSGVTKEHPALLAEHIVEPERQDGRSK